MVINVQLKRGDINIILCSPLCIVFSECVCENENIESVSLKLRSLAQ